jgi:hypothetical protein
MEKTSYISPDTAQLEITLISQGRPEALVSLDMGIPQWPVWSIRVPMDDEDGETILNMAVQAMAEDLLFFLLSMEFDEELAKSLFAMVMLGYDKVKIIEPGMDGDSASYRVDIPLDEVFVKEVHKTIITAAATKRNNTSVKPIRPVRRMEMVRQIPKGKALTDAQRIIQKYKNRSLKGQPRPLFILVYDTNGRPIGVSKL